MDGRAIWLLLAKSEKGKIVDKRVEDGRDVESIAKDVFVGCDVNEEVDLSMDEVDRLTICILESGVSVEEAVMSREVGALVGVVDKQDLTATCQ